MKLSIIIPVYYNEENLYALYEDIYNEIISKIDYEYEIIMVDDGSQDKSYSIMKKLADRDLNIKTISLSRNFGSHAAILCGLANCSGDCAVIKTADLQEPSQMILDMVDLWKKGNKVVLAIRKDRQENLRQKFFASLYYWMMKKVAFPDMPVGGFDVYLIDRKVIKVLISLDEKNSALTGQILWSGFTTERIYYTRLKREVGISKWTLKKKLRLVADSLFSFSTLPIALVSLIGAFSFIGAFIWAIIVVICKLRGYILVSGWTTLFIFNLFSFGIIMMTLGILGGYLWRTFDASRKRPPFIVEEESENNDIDKKNTPK